MNKTTKKLLTIVLQGVLIIVMIFLAFFTKMFVRSCNSAVGDFVNSPKEPEPIERINEIVNHMNTICPIYFESWAKIESFTINQNDLTIKIVIDDDFVESYNEGTFVLAVHQQFENEVSNIENLQKVMDATQMQIKLSVYKTSGDIIETKRFRNKDIFDSPIVRMEEDRNLERTLQQADIASKVTPYSY